MALPSQDQIPWRNLLHEKYSTIQPAMNTTLLQRLEHSGEGYAPLVDYANWRVAVLNFSPDLLPERLTRMQRHNETDEVFVLLAGRCLLFVGEGQEEVSRVYAEDLKPGLVYNVKRGVWHTHTLTADARVLVVENRDTTYANSPFVALSLEQQQYLVATTRSYWGAILDPVPGGLSTAV